MLAMRLIARGPSDTLKRELQRRAREFPLEFNLEVVAAGINLEKVLSAKRKNQIDRKAKIGAFRRRGSVNG